MKVIAVVLSLVFAAAGGILIINRQSSEPATKNNLQTTPTPTSTAKPTEKEETVPEPNGEDVIRTFFNLIHTNQVIPAIDMLSENFIQNENTKQKIGVLFNSFTAIQPIEIKAYQKENWTENSQKYEVTLDVALSLDDEQWVLQNYGWSRGENKRWVKLTKENNLWKIAVLATGP